MKCTNCNIYDENKAYLIVIVSIYVLSNYYCLLCMTDYHPSIATVHMGTNVNKASHQPALMRDLFESLGDASQQIGYLLYALITCNHGPPIPGHSEHLISGDVICGNITSVIPFGPG